MAACAPQTESVSGCDRVASAEIAFTGGDAPDTVEARTFGPNCAHAVGVLVIRAPDGAPVWSWTAPLYPTFGAGFAPVQGADVDAAVIQTFLGQWTQLAPLTTADAPAWAADAAGPEGDATALLERAVYDDVRARGAPMTCHLSSVGVETCVYWESAAAIALPIVQRTRREAAAAPTGRAPAIVQRALEAAKAAPADAPAAAPER